MKLSRLHKGEMYMSRGVSGFGRVFWIGAAIFYGLFLASSAALAQKFVVTPVTEKKVSQLPAGTLYWRVETFPTLADAHAAAGPTALAAEVDGKFWLFTLAPAGGSS